MKLTDGNGNFVRDLLSTSLVMASVVAIVGGTTGLVVIALVWLSRAIL